MSGGSFHIDPRRIPEAWRTTGRIAGRYYGGFPTWGAGMSNTVITLDRLYATPFNVGNRQAFDQIAVAALAVASSTIRLGIYSDNNGKPGELIVDGGAVSCGTAGVKTVTVSVTLCGKVWAAAAGQGVAPQIRCMNSFGNPDIGVTSIYSTDQGTAYSQNSVSGAFPATWGSTYNTDHAYSAVPFIALRSA